MEQKVSLDTARAEVEKWQDMKRIPEKKREALSTMADNMVEAIMSGNLVFEEETGTLRQTLVFPEGTGVTELTYKLRITDRDKEQHKRLIKGDSFADELTRTILALTGASINAIRNLDTSTDRGLAESIAVFF